MELTERFSVEEQFILSLFSEKREGESLHSYAAALDSRKLNSVLKSNKLLRRTAWECRNTQNILFEDDKFILPRFERYLILWTREKEIYLDALYDITEGLSGMGIQSCLLKGLSLGDPDIPRDIGDLDILIHEKDLLRAAKLMEQKGYIYVGDERKDYLRDNERGGNFEALKSWSNQFEFLNKKTGLLVELHTNFFERRRIYSFDIDPIWNSVDKVFSRAGYSQVLQCRVLIPEDSLWLLALHCSIRRCPPRGMFVFRYFIDMADIINRSNINWDALYQQALDTHTSGFLYFSFYLLSGFYPGIVSDTVLQKLRGHLSVGERLLHTVQVRCFRTMQSQRKLWVFIYNMMLPYCYNGTVLDKLKSVLILPWLIKPMPQVAHYYRVDPGEWFVPFLYFLEPVRILGSALKRTTAAFFGLFRR